MCQDAVCRGDRPEIIRRRNSATQRVVRGSTQYRAISECARLAPCRVDNENDSGRKLLHGRGWHRVPPPVIGQDRRYKGVHGHNRGSTSGCGPVRAVPTGPEHRGLRPIYSVLAVRTLLRWARDDA